MAKNIGATLSLKDNNFFVNIKKAASESDKLKGTLAGTTSMTERVGGGFKSLALKAAGVVAAYVSIGKAVSFGKECIEMANAQVAAETRLETTMKNVKGTTDEQVQSIKKYAAELQKTTTIGDEVTISGTSQLATFQLQSETIKTLTPALQDLAVGQYGINVSQEQIINSGNLLGKVMTGQTGALKKAGVSFSATQEAILKTGTESEKAAVLVDVLKQNYGGLAEAMANTPEGRVVQLKNAWGDVKEVIGTQLYPVVTNTLNWMADKIPVIQDLITGIVTGNGDLIHSATSQGGDIVVSLAKGAVARLPEIISTGGTVVLSFIGGITDQLPELIPTICDGVMAAVVSVGTLLPDIWITGMKITEGLAKGIVVGIPRMVEKIPEVIMGFSNKMTENKPQIIQTGVNIIVTLVTGIINAIPKLAVAIPRIFLALSNAVIETNWFEIGKEIIVGIKNGLLQTKGVSEALSGIHTMATTKFDKIKTSVVNSVTSAKNASVAKIDEMKSLFILKFSGIKDGAVAKFTEIKTGIIEKINAAKQGVSDAINKIKGFFKFDWELPKIKLPHFNISGSFSLNPPSIPKFDVQWYRNGGIMTRPTIFGMNGASAMVGGEAGAEAVLPLSQFWDKLRRYTIDAASRKQETGSGKINNTFYVTINADGRSVDDIVDELVPKLKLKLANL